MKPEEAVAALTSYVLRWNSSIEIAVIDFYKFHWNSFGEQSYKNSVKSKVLLSCKFPGGIVVRILGFHCHGLGSVPGQGPEISQVTWPKNKKCIIKIKYYRLIDYWSLAVGLFIFKIFIYLFVWLFQVLVVALGLSLGVAHGLESADSVVAVCGLSCSEACGILVL